MKNNLFGTNSSVVLAFPFMGDENKYQKQRKLGKCTNIHQDRDFSEVDVV